jgi:hypothetical protein
MSPILNLKRRKFVNLERYESSILFTALDKICRFCDRSVALSIQMALRDGWLTLRFTLSWPETSVQNQLNLWYIPENDRINLNGQATLHPVYSMLNLTNFYLTGFRGVRKIVLSDY